MNWQIDPYIPQPPKEKSVNYMMMITLLQVGYTTIEVEFDERYHRYAEPPEKTYTYKTRDKCQPGDKFVVLVSEKLCIVTVTAVHDSPRIDPAAPFVYKWTVQKVDRSAYDDHVAKEKEAAEIMARGERLKAQQDMLAQIKDLPSSPEEKARLDALIAELTGSQPALR